MPCVQGSSGINYWGFVIILTKTNKQTYVSNFCSNNIDIISEAIWSQLLDIDILLSNLRSCCGNLKDCMRMQLRSKQNLLPILALACMVETVTRFSQLSSKFINIDKSIQGCVKIYGYYYKPYKFILILFILYLVFYYFLTYLENEWREWMMW